MMRKKTIFLGGSLAILACLVWIFLAPKDNGEEFSEKVKISLRDVGNQILLSNQDSTSLIRPVVQLEPSKYELSFQTHFSLEPKQLVSIVDSSFQRAKLPNNYRVEVVQCTDQEVAYSYEMNSLIPYTIVPCGTRTLPVNCYTIEVRYIDKALVSSNRIFPLLLLVLVAGMLLATHFYYRKSSEIATGGQGNSAAIGSFRFYPEQNKLVKEAVEIGLSKKECELLTIFVEHPNQVVKRDELTKKVWEDNGVIVGRSLDTYVSKLRKKLKEDDSIKITNVHGVGYKLELKQ